MDKNFRDLSLLKDQLLAFKVSNPGCSVHVTSSDRTDFSKIGPVVRVVEQVGLAKVGYIIGPGGD